MVILNHYLVLNYLMHVLWNQQNEHAYFPLVRKGIETKSFGGYDISDADCIALCEPLMMLYDDSTFKKSINIQS